MIKPHFSSTIACRSKSRTVLQWLRLTRYQNHLHWDLVALACRLSRTSTVTPLGLLLFALAQITHFGDFLQFWALWPLATFTYFTSVWPFAMARRTFAYESSHIYDESFIFVFFSWWTSVFWTCIFCPIFIFICWQLAIRYGCLQVVVHQYRERSLCFLEPPGLTSPGEALKALRRVKFASSKTAFLKLLYRHMYFLWGWWVVIHKVCTQ